MSRDKTQWLRPASTLETFLCKAQDVSSIMVSTYGLTLRTKHPLTDGQVKKALVHLFRKVPTQRLCFRERDDCVLWACEMDHEDIDFKVLESSDQLKVQEELMDFQFDNKKGPLWCARLLHQGSYGGTTSPNIETEFPHSRSLVWANHHGIADGTTNSRTVNALIRILDDVIAGKDIDDTDQFGEFVSCEESNVLFAQAEEEVKKDEKTLMEVLAEMEKQHESVKLIPRAFPHHEDPNYTTKIVSDTLDEETTKRFIRRCKEEDVTVNSGFISIVNVSLVDFVREAGLMLDSYHVFRGHSVSLRRYWKRDVTRALGCHISFLGKGESVTSNWRDNFWNQARELHRNMRKDLDNYEPIKFLIYFFLGKEEVSIEDLLQTRPKQESDNAFGNIGNLDILIPTDGDQVRLGHLVRTTQCWNERALHMFHSLRGRFMYNFCYTSDFLTEEEANRYVELVFSNLRAVI